MKALVFNNTICQIVEDSETFPVHDSMQWVDCPGDADTDWKYKNGSFEKPAKAEIPYDLGRRMEYPPIGDQLDALFKAGVFPPEMAAKIQEVKDKYPKPE
jgi:hypothetical protein